MQPTFRTGQLLLLCLSLLLLFSSCGDPKKEARRLMVDGIKELDKGNPKAAQQCFEEAVKTDSTLAEAWFYKGSTIYNLDQAASKQAIADLSTAIRLNPAYADAYATRGQIKYYLDDKTGACEDWKKAEKLGKPNMKDKTRFCPYY